MNRRTDNHPFPKDEQVQEALLVLLLEMGGELCALHACDTYAPLADFFHLGQSVRSISRDDYLHDGRDERYWHTWVQFSRERLVDNSDLQCPRRGIWMLTDKGRRHAKAAKDMLSRTLYSFGSHVLAPVSPAELKPENEITLADLGL